MQGQAAPATERPPGLPVLQAFRHRNFRLYWSGFLVSLIGLAIQQIGQQWLAYELTGSPLYLGFVGTATALPTIALTLFGGVVADRFDRRRLLLVTQAGLGCTAAGLALLVIAGWVRPWHLLLFAALAGAISAFDQPLRAALVPSLVDRGSLMNAIALQGAAWQISPILGPALGGFLLESVGPAPCFVIAAVGYAVMVAVLLLVRPAPMAVQNERDTLWRELSGGARYIVRDGLFRTLVGLTFWSSFFGLSHIMLLPVFAKDILAIGPQGLGYLNTVSGAGSLAGTMAVASFGERMDKRRTIAGGAFLFGLGLVAFSFLRWPPAALLALGLSRLAQSLAMTTTTTVVQSLVPDHLRGRVMGIYILNWSLMPLGSLPLGAVASGWGAPAAVALGGGLVAVAAVAATWNKELRALRA